MSTSNKNTESATLRDGLISRLRRLANSGDNEAKSKLAHAEDTVKKIKCIRIAKERTEEEKKRQYFTERNLYKELILSRWEASLDTEASFKWMRTCRKIRRLGYGIMIEWAEQAISDGIVPLYCYREIIKRENFRNKEALKSRVCAESELVKL